MGRFVIWNLTQEAYVALPGRQRAYTTNLTLARFFKTREAALADLCGDERIVALSDII